MDIVDSCIPVTVAIVIVMAAACEYVRFVNEDNRHHRRRKSNGIIVTHNHRVGLPVHFMAIVKGWDRLPSSFGTDVF